jgi:hypothetical protein
MVLVLKIIQLSKFFNGSIYAKSSLDFGNKSRVMNRIQAEDSKDVGKIVKPSNCSVIVTVRPFENQPITV